MFSGYANRFDIVVVREILKVICWFSTFGQEFFNNSGITWNPINQWKSITLQIVIKPLIRIASIFNVVGTSNEIVKRKTEVQSKKTANRMTRRGWNSIRNPCQIWDKKISGQIRSSESSIRRSFWFVLFNLSKNLKTSADNPID